MVPSFLQLVQEEEAILVWHLSIGKTNITEYIIKPVARYDVMESKWSTFSHPWCRCGPPVPTTINSNPSYHVEPTINTFYKPLKIHCHTHPYVGLGGDYLLNIFL